MVEVDGVALRKGGKIAHEERDDGVGVGRWRRPGRLGAHCHNDGRVDGDAGVGFGGIRHLVAEVQGKRQVGGAGVPWNGCGGDDDVLAGQE